MDHRATSDERKGKATGEEPERTCAVTRAKLPPEAMIRFVAGPDEQIFPDLAGKLPGRGIWVVCARSKVAEAARTNAFARSLKRKVTAAADLADLVDLLLVRRAVDALSLANKAGLVVPGFTKTEILIAQGEAYALVHAREAADDGAGKLDRRLKAVQMELDQGPDIRVVRILGVDELSLAIGRPHVVHAALKKGGAVQNFLRETGRLQSYRSETLPDRTSDERAARPSKPRSDTEHA
jgi:uncharacterized protein